MKKPQWAIIQLSFFSRYHKCKKDRSPSSPQQCPLCMNPRTSKGKPLVMVLAAVPVCQKPTIDPSLKLKNLTVLEDSGSMSISP